ncbi:MAG: glycosyl hydrolase family 18 protein [Bacteroidota bacterium]
MKNDSKKRFLTNDLLKAFFIIIMIFSFVDILSAHTILPNETNSNKSIDTLLPVDTIVGGYLPSYEMTNISPDVFNYLNQVYYFALTTDSLGAIGTLDNPGNFTSLDSLPSVKDNMDSLISWRGTKAVKIFVCIGGWVQSRYFQKAMTKSTSRANLIANIKNFCQSYGIDGVVVDWEAYQCSVVDSLYGFFINELKAAFSGTSLQISAAIGPTHTSLVSEFANADFIQLMSYGAYLSQNTQVTMSTLQGWVNGWVNAGYSINKIVIGLPAYGRTPSDGTSIKYRQALNLYNVLPSQDTVTSNGKLYYYNGVNTIKTKTQYAVSNHLRGVMFWELGQDTIPSNPMSLLYAVNEIIPVNPQVQASVNQLNPTDISQLNIYPNPSNGIFNITANNKPENVCNVTIYNLMGNLVKEFEWNGENNTIYLSNYASGIYFIKVSYKDKIEVKKIMVR